jgi:5-(aminomethyl)-3-furanmethanol phosphate kinase
VTLPHDRALIVVKVGGGLTAMPQALQRVCAALGTAGRDWPIVVVPGGGPFADAVRKFDRTVGISAEAAHWMAILAMDQYAHVLAGLIPGAVLVEETGMIGEMLGRGQPVVLAPSRWMRSADVLPHSWDVTSDSIAAFIAGALGARRLILVKPTSNAPDVVDAYFSSTVPAGMPVSVIGCDRLDDLEVRLTS